jgi:type I restriction enzyme S subunit
MNTKQLRQKILDLAIRGKLVPQDPDDEPASVLLERVRAEKERLIKEGKIKRDKKGSTIICGDDKSHYKQLTFELPESWAWARLCDVCEPQETKHPTGETFRYIDIDAIDNKRHCVSEPKVMPTLHAPSRAAKGVHSGDTVFSMVRPYLENIAFVTNDLVDCIASTGFYVCHPYKEIMFPRYLYYYLTSNYAISGINAYMRGDNSPAIRKDEMDNFLVPIPPISEQEKISKLLDQALILVNDVETERSSLSEVIIAAKSKILSLAIQGKLVPQDSNDEPASVLLERIRAEREVLIKAGKIKRNKNESTITRSRDNSYYEQINGTIVCINEQIPFNIPDGWAWARLESVCDIARGGSPRPIQNFLTDSDDGINWIKIGDTNVGGKYIKVTKEKIKPTGIKHSRYVKAGDFLLTNSMSFGRPYILKIDGCIHDGWLVLSRITKVFDSDYLYYALSSPFMYELLSRLAVGSTVKNLKIDTVKAIVFPIPPIREQVKIANEIKNAITYLDEIAENLNLTM